MQYPYLSKALCQKTTHKVLFYLSQEALKEYLANAEVYKRKKRLTNNELIEMIITEKPITITHFNKDEEMTEKQAIDLLYSN